MAFIKQSPFTKKTTDLPDKPSPNYSPSDIKTYMQTPADELMSTLNKLVDDLNANYWVDRNKLKNLEVIREKIALGAVGVDQLDPAILAQPTIEFEVQAKFQDHDEKFADNDKKTGSWVDVTEKPYNAVGDGITNDTLAIQQAIDTGKKNIYLPSGKTFLVSNLSLNTTEQQLTFGPGAKLKSNGSTGAIVTINADYVTINNGYISGDTGGASAGIETKGFRNLLNNCTVTGTTVDALKVNGLETIVILGKYKGGTTSGINVLKPDLYIQNAYVEGNRDGLYSNGVGSITAHHVHSFNNTRHGFYLVGASYSQLNSCYADTNGSNGYEISNTTDGLTLVDCWGYKSSNVTANQSDFAFYNAKNVKLIGCHSNGVGAKTKEASYKFDSASQVDLIACHAAINPTGVTGLISFTNCGGILQKYNRPTDVFESDSYTISASTTSPISVRTLVPPLATTPGILAFEVFAKIRDLDNTSSSVGMHLVLIGSGVTVTTPVTNITPTTPIVGLSNPTFVNGGDGYYNLNFDANNTKTESVQVSFNVRYLGTGRGYS
ncbi:glycosyl hydrolase family 28-related protein [Metabacillus sp. Hm71]|uniref:glycosyl hydrolase family 28-related protein n=1 Tax=Metabacillus sp. Hm71 TaxID=3450743 RepID=UPI003F42BB95